MNKKIPPLALTCVFMIFMVVLSWLFPQFILSIPNNNIVAVCIALIGVLISVMGIIEFRRAQTTVNPTKLNQASSLVVKGIYRISRNPMYLGFLLFLLAWGIYLSNSLSLLLCPLAFVVYINGFQIPLEEEALKVKFGEDFLLYKSNVRRWI